MSSLAGRKNVLTLALLALGIATISTMLVPHVAFAGGDENNCDDNDPASYSGGVAQYQMVSDNHDNNNCCDNNDDDPASYSGHIGIYSVSDNDDDNNCDEDDP